MPDQKRGKQLLPTTTVSQIMPSSRREIAEKVEEACYPQQQREAGGSWRKQQGPSTTTLEAIHHSYRAGEHFPDVGFITREGIHRANSRIA
jgi:hypothetical protein